MTKWLVVTLVASLAVGFTAADASAEEHRVEIKGLKYKPAKLKIKKGDKVVWVNSDDRDHTVVSDDEAFDSGKIAAGETFEFTFEKAGKHSYGCDYHPRMKGVVEVSD